MKTRLALPCLFVALVCAVFAVSSRLGAAALGESTDSVLKASSPRRLGTSQVGPTDEVEVESFFDGQLHAQLEEFHIAGATVSVVKDGRVLFAKGYGVSDVASGQPVAADRTLFRVGSISKLFVATAVMQQVEQGKLDLHTDVNSYLKDFKVRTNYEPPITLANLLTHTAGFGDSFKIFSLRASDVRPLRETLSQDLPRQVSPPGVVTSYSNHGITLAALLVEVASGVPFNRYVEEHVFQPLNMRHSTFEQPLPANLVNDVSEGYASVGSPPSQRPFEFVRVAPAGGMSTTATDMAAFMIAHLQTGRLGSTRILEESTANEMHAVQFTNNPSVSGMAYGFFTSALNGQRILGHDGDTLLFHSGLLLLPDQQTGVFVSYNSSGGQIAREKLTRAFLEHYFPTTNDMPPVATTASGRGADVTGWYRPTRTSYDDSSKIFALLNSAHVTRSSDGKLVTPNAIGEMKQWVEISPGVYREEDGQEIRVFEPTSDGVIRYMFYGNSFAGAVLANEKAGWFESPPFHLTVLGSTLALFLFSLLFWPALAMSRRIRRRPDTGSQGQAAIARSAGWALCATAVIFSVGIASSVIDLTRILEVLDSPLFRALMALSIATAALSVAVLVAAFLVWKLHFWNTISRIHFTLVAISGVVFTAELHYWNLLGYNF